jgi:endonuclease YncB( thermonuclease family)
MRLRLGGIDACGDLAFGAAAFAAAVLLGWLALTLVELAISDLNKAIMAALLFIVALHLSWRAVWRRLWHTAANAFAPSVYKPMSSPRVIDGDTIDDVMVGVRYRLANIDAPELDSGARCAMERRAGEEAKAAMEGLIYNAKSVTVRPTWRTDCYGRKVAFVYADGIDVGELLIGARLAVRWRGARRRWCGERGGFAQLAALDGRAFACSSCTLRRPLPITPRRSGPATRLRRSP